MTTHITGVRTVSIPVGDQDAALRFYVGTARHGLPQRRALFGNRFPGQRTSV